MNERPSHPAWTREERARHPWLPLPARPRGRATTALVVAVAVLGSSPPAVDRLRWVAESIVGGTEPWLVYPVLGGALLVPWAAMIAVALLDHVAHRAGLIDRDGILFDHTDTWPGARLRWVDILGFRLVDGGIRFVVRGRPWTRWVGPQLACDDVQQHEVVVLLEQQGVRRFDA